MPYEVVSRLLAYISCCSTLSLFATSMAIAAINVGALKPSNSCPAPVCTSRVQALAIDTFGGLTSKAHVEAVASVLWSRKI